MININGKLVDQTDAKIPIDNRGFTYGDAVFETLKFAQGKILFWENHYFRLMAGMRILRMDIPMHFTPEFLEEQISEVLQANDLTAGSARIKLLVNRKTGGFYQPESSDVDFLISARQIASSEYVFHDDPYLIDLFKDYFVSADLLSTVKSNNKLINVLGSIYALENELDNCLLLNNQKMIVEALNGNFFLVQGNILKTPPINDGCLKGIMREQILKLAKDKLGMEIDEASISPFEIQKSDEAFITNVIRGIQSVTNYRKKKFQSQKAKALCEALNESIKV